VYHLYLDDETGGSVEVILIQLDDREVTHGYLVCLDLSVFTFSGSHFKALSSNSNTYFSKFYLFKF
jgi:hypothetical protein